MTREVQGPKRTFPVGAQPGLREMRVSQVEVMLS